MRNERIMELERNDEIQMKGRNKPRAMSLLEASKISAEFAMSVEINEKNSTAVFKEMYDAFRQLGDAKWWLRGYEPRSHKASMELLSEARIERSYRLKQLERYRKLRNEANYKGYRIPPSLATEIVKLWKDESSDIIKWVKE